MGEKKWLRLCVFAQLRRFATNELQLKHIICLIWIGCLESSISFRSHSLVFDTNATMVTSSKLIVSLAMIISYSSSAFQASIVKNPIPTQLDMFGNAMKKAFSNDDTLGKRDDAGIKKVRVINLMVVNISFCSMNILVGQVVHFRHRHSIISHIKGTQRQ